MKIVLNQCTEITLDDYAKEIAELAKNNCDINAIKLIDGDPFKLVELTLGTNNTITKQQKENGENYYKIVIVECSDKKVIFVIELHNFDPRKKDNSETDIKVFRQEFKK